MLQLILNKDQIKELAWKIAQQLEKTDIMLLSGDLGAGKTFFTKQICGYFNHLEGKNINICSPTFLFYHQYQYKRLLISHYDLYRFEREINWQDLQGIDFEDSIEAGCVIVEWADKLNFSLSKNTLFIKIDFDNALEVDQEKRVYTICFNKENIKWKDIFL